MATNFEMFRDCWLEYRQQFYLPLPDEGAQPPPVDACTLSDSWKILDREVTKLGSILTSCGSDFDPSFVNPSLMSTFEAYKTVLTNLNTMRLAAMAGPSLNGELITYADELANAFSDLGKSVEAVRDGRVKPLSGSSKGEQSDLARKVGVLLSHVPKLEKLPQNNGVSVKSKMLKVVKCLRSAGQDVRRELEAQEEKAQALQMGGDSMKVNTLDAVRVRDNDSDSLEDDEDDFEDMDDEERDRAAKVCEVIDTVEKSMLATLHAMTQGLSPEEARQAARVRTLEQAREEAENISVTVDDLANATYAPQDRSEMFEAANELHHRIQILQEMLRDALQASSLDEAAFESAKRKLNRLCTALVQQRGE